MTDLLTPPEAPLHRAARLGDLVELKHLLTAGTDLNARTDKDQGYGTFSEQLTPLMVAACSTEGSTVATLRWLVEQGADLHAQSAGGVTAAWYAAGAGPPPPAKLSNQTADYDARLRFLLDAGLDAHEMAANGRSLLVEACSVGDPARVALLLERGVPATPSFSIEEQRTNRRALLTALLADRDSEVEIQAQIEQELAEWNGQPASFQLPLFCAVESGSAACVQLLLAAGAKPNLRCDMNETPLMAAHNYATVRALLKAGADAFAVNNLGYDAFQCYLRMPAVNEIDEAELSQSLMALLDIGVDVNAELSYLGWTRLYCAAFDRNDVAIAHLLKLGADPQRGRPPLNGICWHYNRDYHEHMALGIDLLVAAGCDVNARDAAGDTLLHCAALGLAYPPNAACFNQWSDGSNVTAVHCLLKHGADPDPVGERGWTPLMLAAADQSLEIVRTLLAAGADPKRQNAEEDNATDIARKTYKRYKRQSEKAKPADKALYEKKRQAAAECWYLLQQG